MIKKLSSDRAEKLINEIRTQLSKYFQKNNLKTAVFGKSKGVDSSVIAGLLTKTPNLQPLGVIMPCYSEPDDKLIAKKVLKYFNIPYLLVNLEPLYDSCLKQYNENNKIENELIKIGINVLNNRKEVAYGNIKARLRMITLYHIAQLTGGAVIGSGNFSERMTGFWTLHGDVGDLNPITKLYKNTEVYALARSLKVPKESLNAVPSDGLLKGNTDKKQLGLSYDKLDSIIYQYLKGIGIANIAKQSRVSKEKAIKIIDKIKKSEHKRKNLDK